MSSSSERRMVALSVGNTRTAVAVFTGSTIGRVMRLENAIGAAQIAAQVIALVEEDGNQGEDRVAVVIATVNEPVSREVIGLLRQAKGAFEVLRIGKEITPAIGTCIDPETMTGQDRLLNAAAAFEKYGQACVVIDVGTAVTVDFVDGQGTFHGGAIAAGARMQLAALHEHTSALPQIEFASPDAEAFGASTSQAMLHGVFYGIRGMVRHLAERYAEQYRAYPMIVATGGDAAMLFRDDEFVEHIVDDLGLHGIRVSFDAAHGVHRVLDSDRK